MSAAVVFAVAVVAVALVVRRITWRRTLTAFNERETR